MTSLYPVTPFECVSPQISSCSSDHFVRSPQLPWTPTPLPASPAKAHQIGVGVAGECDEYERAGECEQAGSGDGVQRAFAEPALWFQHVRVARASVAGATHDRV